MPGEFSEDRQQIGIAVVQVMPTKMHSRIAVSEFLADAIPIIRVWQIAVIQRRDPARQSVNEMAVDAGQRHAGHVLHARV